MRVALALAAILLVVPTGISTSGCEANVCASTYGASTGSCNGDGSERNDASVVVSDLAVDGEHTGAAAADAHTFCMRAGQQSYRELIVGMSSSGPAGSSFTYIALRNDDGSCSALVMHSDPASGAQQRGSGCDSDLPPNVPMVLV